MARACVPHDAPCIDTTEGESNEEQRTRVRPETLLRRARTMSPMSLARFIAAGIFVAALTGVAYGVHGKYKAAFYLMLPAVGWALRDIIKSNREE